MSEQSPKRKTFTGNSRRKETAWSVRFGDVAAKWCITVGGIGTIVTVCAVFVFLGLTAMWLFMPTSIVEEKKTELSGAAAARPIQFAVDEYGTIAWSFFDDGRIEIFRPDTGESIESRKLFGEEKLTASSFVVDEPEVAFGFADGAIRIGSVAFKTTFLEADESDLPDAVAKLEVNERAMHGGGVVTRTEQGQLRLQTVGVELGEPIKASSAPILLIDQTTRQGKSAFCVVTGDGELLMNKITSTKNLLTGKITLKTQKSRLPYQPDEANPPKHLVMIGLGETVAVIAENGDAVRFDARDFANPVVAERLDVTPKKDARVTAVAQMIGRRTVLIGDSLGVVTAWFGHRDEKYKTSDTMSLQAAHELVGASAPITSLSVSARSRMAFAGDADGAVHLYQVTNNDLLLSASVASTPVWSTAVGPKDDRLLALTEKGIWTAELDLQHPEASFSSLFLPVWYEGGEGPEFVWQSTSGTSDFEPKVSLMPLILGTLKATFYSMLFGAPLALLAAIYTSEFMQPKWRARIKPSIELMASLPSVVLGFLAGNILAQYAEDKIPIILASLVAVPFAVACGAYLWQILPNRVVFGVHRSTLRWTIVAAGLLIVAAALSVGFLVWNDNPPLLWIALIALSTLLGATLALGGFKHPVLSRGDSSLPVDFRKLRVVFIFLAVVAGLALGASLGGATEKWLFADDLMQWADGNIGTGFGGWMMLFLPLSAIGTAVVVGLLVNPWMRARFAALSSRQMALINLAKFLLVCVAALGFAASGAQFLVTLGLDPRGDLGFVNTYQQRNALVVGFVMGFAIIPIIYTIAEDALSTVPHHLRSASLATGATPWQTAIRIVVPTAMSGLFSALMIGLGRAVGETMIVLMAAGNSPILGFNLFDGFRSLAANIAVELPEAAAGGTHYRILFLTALVLFAMTFCVNTVAEVVRTRFRRRAYQL